MDQNFNRDLVTVIEFENVYAPYTGELTGYRFKAEYQYKKTQSESIYHRIEVDCELCNKGKGLKVSIETNCAPLEVSGGLVNYNFNNTVTTLGAKTTITNIIGESFFLMGTIKKSNKAYEERR